MSCYTYGQGEYEVLFCSDGIYSREVQIKKGYRISKNDSIWFKNPHAILKICYNNCSETRVISGLFYSEIQKENTGFFEDYVVEMSTRGNHSMSISKLSDITDFATVGIVDSLMLPIAYAKLTTGKRKFFFVRYTVKGVEVNKRILVENQNLIFGKYLFEVRKIEVIPDSTVSIFYHNKSKKTSVLINKGLSFLFYDSEELRKIEAYYPDIIHLDDDEKYKVLLDNLLLQCNECAFSKINILKS